jgi:metacaspase-1
MGIAIHVGLDSVDPDAYGGWDGALAACENDAIAMEELTSELGYETQTLLSSQATSEAVFDAIADAAGTLRRGGICVITYAGHGGQFADLGSEEEDRLDETWLLHDREVLDDEIRMALSAFDPGVRVVVLSDSCHSGTVVRAIYERLIDDSPAVQGAYHRVAPRLRTRSGIAAKALRLRGAPPEVQRQVLAAHRRQYEEIRARTPSRDEISMAASVLLISGCQDNQESAEENGHGVFTAALLDRWDRGAFTGDYRALHNAIRGDLPPTQSPNLLTVGMRWLAFERQVPFTIDPPDDSPPDDGEPEDQATPQSDGAPLVQVVNAQSDVVVVKFGGRRGRPGAR